MRKSVSIRTTQLHYRLIFTKSADRQIPMQHLTLTLTIRNPLPTHRTIKPLQQCIPPLHTNLVCRTLCLISTRRPITSNTTLHARQSRLASRARTTSLIRRIHTRRTRRIRGTLHPLCFLAVWRSADGNVETVNLLCLCGRSRPGVGGAGRGCLGAFGILDRLRV